MQNDRKKQRFFKKLRNALVTATVIIVLVYIGMEPYLAAQFGSVQPFHLALLGIVVITLGTVFYYESAFAKKEESYDIAEKQRTDAGYYFTSRETADKEVFYREVKEDLAENGYKISEVVTVDELTFDMLAVKAKEVFFAVRLSKTEKSDVIAYTDAAVNYLTSQLMKRSCDGVVLFIGDSVDENALPLSKQFTKLVTGRHNCVTVYPAVLELESKKVYFLGNVISRAQKMVVHYVMNCDFPIKEQYIGKEKLTFQREFDNEI